MSGNDINSLVYSKNVIEFITVANEFCSFLERADELQSVDFIGRLQKILPLLYLKASLLPDFDFEPDDDLDRYVTEVEYNLVQQKVLAHTGSGDDYQEVFLPGMQFSETALTASISENIADIFQDVKDMLMSFRTMDEAVMLQALLEIRQGFEQVWGQKLVNCLRAVHNLFYSEHFSEEKSGASQQKAGKAAKKPDWLNDRFFNQED